MEMKSSFVRVICALRLAHLHCNEEAIVLKHSSTVAVWMQFINGFSVGKIREILGIYLYFVMMKEILYNILTFDNEFRLIL